MFCWNLLPRRSMKNKTASSSEMLVNFYQTKWHHTPEGSILNNHHCWAFRFMWRMFTDRLERRTSEMFMLLCNINQICILSKLIIYVFYMFRTWGFIFRKTVVCVGMVYVLHDNGISGQVEVCVGQCRAHTSTCGLLISSRKTLPYMYIQPSSWRWTLGFETSRRYHKLKY